MDSSSSHKYEYWFHFALVVTAVVFVDCYYHDIAEKTMNSNYCINVHPLTENPTKAWESLKKTQKCMKIQPPVPKGPVDKNKTEPQSVVCADVGNIAAEIRIHLSIMFVVRVVCMSDTHSKTSLLKFDIPFGDIFIHAGDFTSCGGLDEVLEFNEWLGTLPHKLKIVIAGNHELSFDSTFTQQSNLNNIPTLGFEQDQIRSAIQHKDIKKYLTNCIYLEDSMIECYGLKIYGSPWQPEYGGWAFNIPRGQSCLDKWNKIPAGVDILVTHSPPLGYGDDCCSGVRAGCVELLFSVQERIKPKYHVFGHVHEGYGISTDGKIIYINASSCDLQYLPVHHPIVFDVALPKGVLKM